MNSFILVWIFKVEVFFIYLFLPIRSTYRMSVRLLLFWSSPERKTKRCQFLRLLRSLILYRSLFCLLRLPRWPQLTLERPLGILCSPHWPSTLFAVNYGMKTNRNEIWVPQETRRVISKEFEMLKDTVGSCFLVCTKFWKNTNLIILIMWCPIFYFISDL